jgi:hypothetical protein
MSATIEIKYYNSFWLKKLASINAVKFLDPTGTGNNSTQVINAAPAGSNTITISTLVADTLGPGQIVTYSLMITQDGVQQLVTFDNYVIYKEAGQITNQSIITLGKLIPNAIQAGIIVTFGKFVNNTWMPSSYIANNATDWYIEEARIRGGFNNTSVDFGAKAYIVDDFPRQERLISSMIFSGVFNSKTGVNNTNQFSVAEDITRTADPANGSIQKLFAEDTNLTIFQELKVSRALIDKDAIYSADGKPMTTSGASVIGQIQSYDGNYGIGKHPESFAVYGYRKYFTDDYQNVVLRLSQDGITEISNLGMFDYFRDQLSNFNLNKGFLFGMWDTHSKQYVLSIQPDQEVGTTLAFDEDSSGWTSFFSYVPNQGTSLRNSLYTFNKGGVYKHYSQNVPRAQFYGVNNKSNVTLIFNPNSSVSKSFLTINYEGTNNWALTSFYTDTDTAVPVTSSRGSEAISSSMLENQLFSNNFKNKENKYFATVLNISNVRQSGEVLFGQSVSGIKGYFSTAIFECDNVGVVSSSNKAELFAVSAEYIESSY